MDFAMPVLRSSASIEVQPKVLISPPAVSDHRSNSQCIEVGPGPDGER